MITLDEAYHASTYETWLTYWKQCRVTLIVHKHPDFTDEYNPYLIRWREIPEGEDATVPHPDIEVKQMQTAQKGDTFAACRDTLPDESAWRTKEGVEQSTQKFHEAIVQRERDFDEFLEYKKNGNLNVETIDETKPISWDSIRNASTEELFQTKLEIFESPPVQKSENKEYRGNIRKAASII